mmetsp:Transcript_66414/g.190911  ORF Transcript_66414/g.190911 Transcript_66414/m.190911 type:complete len:268 (+) Transcript_66414:109-912(+)
MALAAVPDGAFQEVDALCHRNLVRQCCFGTLEILSMLGVRCLYGFQFPGVPIRGVPQQVLEVIQPFCHRGMLGCELLFVPLQDGVTVQTLLADLLATRKAAMKMLKFGVRCCRLLRCCLVVRPHGLKFVGMLVMSRFYGLKVLGSLVVVGAQDLEVTVESCLLLRSEDSTRPVIVLHFLRMPLQPNDPVQGVLQPGPQTLQTCGMLVVLVGGGPQEMLHVVHTLLQSSMVVLQDGLGILVGRRGSHHSALDRLYSSLQRRELAFEFA